MDETTALANRTREQLMHDFPVTEFASPAEARRKLLLSFGGVMAVNSHAIKLPSGLVITREDALQYTMAQLHEICVHDAHSQRKTETTPMKIPELGELLDSLEKGGADRIKKFLRPTKGADTQKPRLRINGAEFRGGDVIRMPYGFPADQMGAFAPEPPPPSLGRRLGVGTNVPGYAVGMDTSTTTAGNPLGSISFPFGATGTTP